MTHRDAKSYFVAEIIPTLNEQNGPDYPLRREAWNVWVDNLHRQGNITDFQAQTWVQPSICYQQRGA